MFSLFSSVFIVLFTKALQLIRNEFRTHWLIFVIRPVMISEAYIQFLEQFHVSKEKKTKNRLDMLFSFLACEKSYSMEIAYMVYSKTIVHRFFVVSFHSDKGCSNREYNGGQTWN